MAGSAMALMIDHGTKILLVDGTDPGSTVDLQSTDVEYDGYHLKYSLNGGGWSNVTDGWWNSDQFEGGGVLDFALDGQNTNEFYILSDDENNVNFSATMRFVLDIEPSQAQQPEMTTSYFRNVFITWNIGETGTTTYSNSLALASGSFWAGDDRSDGVTHILASTPVPEPGTMIILGTCLLCLGGAASRKKKKK